MYDLKTIIFTHDADIDGMGCAVLAKLVFGEENCDVVFTSPNKVNEDFINALGIGKIYDDDLEIETYNIYGCDKLREYDKIYITDLSINGELLSRVGKNSIASSKVRIFDHHEYNVKQSINSYLFADVKVSDYNGLCSGTSLFYEYLKKKGVIEDSIMLRDFVEKVRRQDTWEWKTIYDDHVANDLAQYFNAVGKKQFVESMIEKIRKNPNERFFFSDEESKIINTYKQEIEKACEECLYGMQIVEKNGIKFGIGNIPYKFRNEMAEFIRELNIKIDVLALPNYEKNTCSFRSINEEVDVNEIAIAYGGGGHKAASSCPIGDELAEDFYLHRENVAMDTQKRKFSLSDDSESSKEEEPKC